MADLTGIDTGNIGTLDYNSAGNADFFEGQIDFLEVQDSLMGKFGVNTTNLFQTLIDEGTGATAADDSGNGNDGTITSATWAVRSVGFAHAADSGRVYHLEDDRDFRRGLWITNTDGVEVLTGTYKIASDADPRIRG